MINKHFNNIYEEEELLRESAVSKMEIVQTYGELFTENKFTTSQSATRTYF